MDDVVMGGASSSRFTWDQQQSAAVFLGAAWSLRICSMHQFCFQCFTTACVGCVQHIDVAAASTLHYTTPHHTTPHHTTPDETTRRDTLHYTTQQSQTVGTYNTLIHHHELPMHGHLYT